ncbi:UNVERIFIED_ORG: hypothetical protein M2328_006087 [Rhodococcus erythropolis]
MPDIREFDELWPKFASAKFGFPDIHDSAVHIDSKGATWVPCPLAGALKAWKWTREVPARHDGFSDPGADPAEAWDKPNPEPIVHHLVQADLEQRLAQGIRTYGQPLRPHNGRDALQDAYEEALDLACYLKQEMLERASKAT